MGGFLAKNRDTLPPDLIELMTGSTSSFIVDLFNEKYLPTVAGILVSFFVFFFTLMFPRNNHTTGYKIFYCGVSIQGSLLSLLLRTRSNVSTTGAIE